MVLNHLRNAQKRLAQPNYTNTEKRSKTQKPLKVLTTAQDLIKWLEHEKKVVA